MGIGTISMSIADLFDRVIGIEINREAVLDAKEAAKENKITNCTFDAMDAKTFLKKNTTPIDVLIVDPPRSGT